jgi:hypothetical protein
MEYLTMFAKDREETFRLDELLNSDSYFRHQVSLKYTKLYVSAWVRNLVSQRTGKTELRVSENTVLRNLETRNISGWRKVYNKDLHHS